MTKSKGTADEKQAEAKKAERLKRNQIGYSDKERNWFITITLKPLLYSLSPTQQREDTKNSVCFILRHIAKAYTVVCELTDALNIHYHCVVAADERSVINALQAMKKDFPKVFGFFNYKEIDDMEKLKEYLKKDWIRTINTFGLNPIVRDTLNLFEPMEVYEELHLKMAQET